ncbi:hypothetical protein PYW08_008573 [Mythimna loreyi]|uniref:Uncharacterized protein n=1 Tax=Mythimna loreyi TaxID=667449 RepID=A0ACC2Q911_9NEOP|nr:hypothetical protein PYW08_008573 [Mythimna loreyi]
MIFYRLAIRLIQYFKIDQIFKEDEMRLIMLGLKPKEVYKTKLKADRRMDLCISALLSLIGAFVCFSLPYATLASPCDVLKMYNMTSVYNMAVTYEKYVKFIDRLTIALFIVLIYVTAKTLVDAIDNTDISMSPWVEMGKYALPKKEKDKKPAPKKINKLLILY